MYGVLSDVKFGLRLFRNSIGSTLLAIFSMALAIGATTAMFSVIHAVIIDPFPYKDIRRTIAIQVNDPKHPKQFRMASTMQEYIELNKLGVFDEVIGTSFEQRVVTGGAAADTYRAVLMSPDGFRFLGVPAFLGRTIGPGDYQNGQPDRVLVLSYARWQKSFGADRSVLGRTVLLNDEPFKIIGVMPPRFTWYGRDSVWMPLRIDPRNTGFVMVRAKLKPEHTVEEARAKVDTVLHRLAIESPRGYPIGFTVSVLQFRDYMVGQSYKPVIYALLGAVALLLLIGCANVANLLLAKATSRSREISVRMAVGAGRIRIARQLLIESLLLAAVSGAAGVAVACFGVPLIAKSIPPFTFPDEAVIAVSIPVLMFSVAVSLVTGVIFGLAPAVQVSRVDLNDSLKDAAKGSSSISGVRTRDALLVIEVALAMILLSGAGLLLRSFFGLTHQELGFNPRNVMVFAIPQINQKSLADRNARAAEILDRARTLPGVEAASIAAGVPPYGGWRVDVAVPGVDAPEAKMNMHYVSSEYFRTTGVRFLSGRLFSEQDIHGALRVAIANEAMVKKYWPNESAIGKTFRTGPLSPAPTVLTSPGDTTFTVIGVAADAKNAGLDQPAFPGAYVPYTIVGTPYRALAVRMSGDAGATVSSVRDAIASIDRKQPVTDVRSLEDIVYSQTAQPRFATFLLGIFAATGLVLAATGIFSVTAYAVSRRTHEIGIRMALGAQRRDVLNAVMGRAFGLALAGIAAGLSGSIFLTKFLASQLYAISPRDPLSLAVVAGTLTITALLACYVPAMKATSVNPYIALRHD